MTDLATHDFDDGIHRPDRRPLLYSYLCTVAVVLVLVTLYDWTQYAPYHPAFLIGMQFDMKMIREDAESYRSLHGPYPESLAELIDSAEKDWQYRDHWRRPYQYRLVDGEPSLRSLGADGEVGGIGADQDIEPGSHFHLVPLAYYLGTPALLRALEHAFLVANIMALLVVGPGYLRRFRPNPVLRAILATAVALLIAIMVLDLHRFPSGH